MEDSRTTTCIPGMLPQPRQNGALSEGQAIANARLQSAPAVSGADLGNVPYDEYLAPDLAYLFSQLPSWDGVDGSPTALSESDIQSLPRQLSPSSSTHRNSTTTNTTRSKGVRFTQPMSIEHFPRRPSSASKLEQDDEFIEHRHRRRKEQNRAAQRNYRDREKQRLQAALVRVQDVEHQLQKAVCVQKHYQQLYETLYGDYQNLLRGMIGNDGISPTASRTSSIDLGDWQSADWLQSDTTGIQSLGQQSSSPENAFPIAKVYSDPEAVLPSLS